MHIELTFRQTLSPSLQVSSFCTSALSHNHGFQVYRFKIVYSFYSGYDTRHSMFFPSHTETKLFILEMINVE